MLAFLNHQRISVTCYHSQPLTRWPKRLMSSRKSSRLQLLTLVRQWLITIKSSCWLSHSVLQKLSGNLHQCWQTELTIRQALKITAKVSETNECTRWPTKCQRSQQKWKRRQSDQMPKSNTFIAKMLLCPKMYLISYPTKKLTRR